MDVLGKSRMRFSPNLFLLLLVASICYEPPAVADGLYGAGYQFQRERRTPAAENDRFVTPRRERTLPAQEPDLPDLPEPERRSSSAPATYSSRSPNKENVITPTTERVTHSSKGPSLHDQDRTTDPWFATEEKLAAYKKTIETSTEKINKDPKDPLPYIDRSDAYLHVWQSKMAIEDANKAISLNPDTPQRISNCYCNRGEALLQLDKYKEALEDLNKAISIDEENAEAYYFRGMAQEKLGYVDVAIKDYLQARDYGFAPKGVYVDFGDYMTNLQRSIKREWHPPKGNETRKTIVVFKVNRTGLLDDLKLTTTSGLEGTNEAALDAVRAAAPFQPLPKGAPRSVDVQFAFDYNVIKKSQFTEEKIGSLTAAEKDAQQRVEEAEKGGDQKVLIDSLFALGDAYREKRNYFYAESTYKRAQELCEKQNDNSFGAGKALARLALVDMDRGKKREAEELFNKSLDLALKAGKSQTDPDAGLVLRDYAKLLYRENRFEDVKKMYARFKTI